MKLVVQDGAGISRRTIERILPFLPSEWRNSVQAIVVYATYQKALTFSYFTKAQLLGIHWPSFTEDAPSLEQAVTELGITLAAIAERGELPRKVSKSLRARALAEIESELPNWLAAAEE